MKDHRRPPLPVALPCFLCLVALFAVLLMRQPTPTLAYPLESLTSPLPGEQVQRASNGRSGDAGMGNSYNASLSGNGFDTAFDSWAPDLVPNDLNGKQDVFVFNERRHEVRLASVSFLGGGANGDSHHASISADGRFVAFSSLATNLVPNDSNVSCNVLTAPPTNCEDIFVRDMAAGQTFRVSMSSSGEQGNLESSYPAISADGQVIAFESLASNLVAGDSNGRWDVFVHDRASGSTSRISIDSSGQQGNNDSRHPIVSANGRFVTFISSASNLVAGDTNGFLDIFIHDRETGHTERVSMASDGAQGNSDSGAFPNPQTSYGAADLTPDGRFVVFGSYATLVPTDTNQVKDVYLRDTFSDTTYLISRAVTPENTSGDGPSYYPSISMDGRIIAFASSATNLSWDTDTNGLGDIFLYDREQDVMRLANLDWSYEQGQADSLHPALSDDGRWVGFDSTHRFVPEILTPNYSDVFIRDSGGVVYGFFDLPAPPLDGARQTSVGWVFAANVDHQERIAQAPIDSSSGYFELRLAPGRWRLDYLLFDPSWYGPRINDGIPVDVTPLGSHDVGHTPIEVAGQQFQALLLAPDGTTPLTQAELLVLTRPPGRDPIVDRVPYDARTGGWHFSVPCGPMLLSARARPEDYPGLVPPAPIRFDVCTDPAPTGPFELTFREGGILLSGEVRLPASTLAVQASTPVSGTYVWAYSPSGGHQHLRTGADGRYEFQLPPGPWLVGARYEDEAGQRYGAPPQHILLEPDDTHVTYDIKLGPLVLGQVPPTEVHPFSPDEDATFDLPGGGQLFIPADTFSTTTSLLGVSEMVTLTIEPTDASLPRTDILIPDDYGYEFTVRDATGNSIETFNGYIRLSLPLTDEDLANSDRLRLFYFDEAYNNYVPIETYVLDEENMQLHGFIDHFSKWADGTLIPLEPAVEGLTATSDAPGGVGMVGDPVTFSASITGGENVIYTWDFGDGTTDAGETVTHTFTDNGTYTVTVTATNSAGTLQATTSVSILPAPILLPIINSR